MNGLLKRRSQVSSFIIVVSIIILTYYVFISVWPLVFNIYMSLSKTDLMTGWKIIWFRNYISIFKDSIFLKALKNNIIYLLVMVPLGIFTSLIIAALLYKVKGFTKKIYIGMIFSPVVTSMVAISLIWKLLYFPNGGIFAQIISKVFHITPPLFLDDPKTALICIIIMDIWRDTGLRTVILHAGMEEIPQSIYEASQIDGISPVTQFFRITIPLLRPQITFLAAIYSINAIRVFSQVYMMTGNPPGGPAHSTQVLVLRMYQEAFYSTRFGTGAAIAMVIFILLFGLVLLEIKSFQQKWEY
ncbi:MAG: sugar ABC transporter permease [Actinobacteria bacterium]|nr:sugar ABC transporter permease [Actinomycetota bacterium]